MDFDTANTNTVVLVSNGVYNVGGKVASGLALTNRVCIEKTGLIVRSVNGPDVTVIEGSGPNGFGAVRCAYVASNSVLDGFTLTGGHTFTSGNGDDMSGGGVAGDYSGYIDNCIVLNNSSGQNGGGAYQMIVRQCIVVSNTTWFAGCGVANCNVYNSLLKNNYGSMRGGAAAYSSLYGCTVVSNSATIRGGGMDYGTARNSIILNNNSPADDNWYDATVNYCCTIPLPTNGVGNIDADPQFVPDSDYHLFASSPCTDSGIYSEYGSDLDGKPRIFDGNGDGVAINDMGCYETRTWYVDASTTNYGTAATNWSSAVSGIQAALSRAGDYDLIVVSNGVYSEGYDWSIGSLAARVDIDKPITVRSVNGADVTIIEGNDGTDGSHILRCAYVGTNAVLEGFTLTGGHTLSSGTTSDRSGAGASCESSGIINSCIITDNTANLSGGGTRYGIINDCIIKDNYAGSYGGGVCYGRINRCDISDNVAAFFGGGSYYAIIRNSLVTYNSAATDGGGAVGGTLINCTIVGNSSDDGGGTYNSTVKNSIVRDNTGNTNSNWRGGSLNHCCTEPLPETGDGNIDDDPQFVPDSDYHTFASSPCIDSGNDEEQYGTVDLGGKARKYDGDGDAVARIDIGCYETRALFVSSGPATDGPGTNWYSAFYNIQDAVDAADSYDVVIVSNGIYNTDGMIAGGLFSRIAIDKPMTVRSVKGPGVTTVVGAGPNGAGAVRCAYVGTNAVLQGFTLKDGHTHTGGSVQEGSGGGAYCVTNATVADCVITGNSAYYAGGGVYEGNVKFCTISSNSVTGTTGDNGGGVSGCNVYNSLLIHNSAVADGGGGSESEFYNCTISANSADTGGGVSYSAVYNSIIWNNTGVSGNNNWLSGSYSYSCTTPLPSGSGNISTDPSLSSAWKPLSAACIDSGNNGTVAGDYDLDGIGRILDSDGDGSVTVDMGCFEYLNYNSDTDGDSMSDGWEHDYGLDYTDASDAHDNKDSDGMDNYAEYVALTDPTDSNSYFSVTAFSNTPFATAYFYSVSDRDYALQSCSDLKSNAWTDVLGAGARAGIDGSDFMQDTNQPPSGRYYRVKVDY